MPSVNTKLANHNDTILIFIHALPECARDATNEVPATLSPTIISDFAALIIQPSIVSQGIYDLAQAATAHGLYGGRIRINEREFRTLQRK
jgi:hypothetical protein